MTAPVLTISDQKAALSGRKQKKKSLKNVLGIPDILKVKCPVVEKNETAKLQEILNRLLPSARLPIQSKTKSDKDSTGENIEDLNLREAAKTKRNQLSLGINVLNKSIKKNSVSAVLLADDIKPKFLINHLNLLCNHHKIPFLHMPELRQLTADSLGFPCIAVGFKTDSCDFVEAVAEIKSLFQNSEVILENENESEASSSESEVEVLESKECAGNDEAPFTYLRRSSVKQRAFVPESNGSDLTETKGDFIPVASDNEIISLTNDSPMGISSNLIRKQKLKELEKFQEKDSGAPKKKKKRKNPGAEFEKKQNPYCPAKLLKIPSNPDRSKKKKIKK